MTRLGVALEITPPREPRPEVLLRRARLLGGLPHAVHVIQRRDRQPSLDAALQLETHGLSAVWHLVTRGRTQAELELEIGRAARGGLRAALVVRGEVGPPESAAPLPLAVWVARIRAALPAARVGVTLNPYLPAERALATLWPKLEAGAAFVQTQPIFAPAPLAQFSHAIRARFPRVQIVPMLIPLPSVSAAERLGDRLGVPLPERLLRGLEERGQDHGWESFAELVRELERSGLADAVAVMTQEADPPKPFTDRLLAALTHSP
jgi:5,10-methylenetetrahydrofolate reductase